MHLNLAQKITDRKQAARTMSLRDNVIALLDAAANLQPKEQRAASRLAFKLEAATDQVELNDTESKLLHTCLDAFPGLQGWARIAIENAVWPDEQSGSDLEEFKARYEMEPLPIAAAIEGNGIAKNA